MLKNKLVHNMGVDSEEKEKVLISITRELRASLTAILGFGGLLKNTPLDDQQKGYLESMLTDGRSLLELVDNMAQFSLLEQNQSVQELIDFDVEFLVNDVFRMVDKKSSYRPVSKYVDVAQGFSHYFKGDPEKLRRVLFNLLDNAIKLSVKGEVCVVVTEVKIEENAEENTEETILRFTVKDTSGGISKQKQKEIESLFNHVGVPFQTSEDMGLVVSKSLVEAMGGKIWMESEEGKGNRFSFTARFQKGGSIFQNKKLEGIKAVIIDDNQGSRTVARRYCEEQGIEVLSVVDSVGEVFEVVDKLIVGKNFPEVILSDVVLAGVPGWMYGYELVKKIQEDERWQDIKIIAMTSDIRYGAMSGVEEGGFDGCLAKPFSRQELLKVFEVVLGLREKEAQAGSHEGREEGCVGIKVLVVEDDISNQRLIKACFNVLGCRGDYASNGKEAIEKLELNVYDMCLMDVMMPVMNGIEATKMIREKISKDFPIVALTAATTEFSRETCLNAGMNDYMIKPLDILKLEEKILQYGRLRW